MTYLALKEVVDAEAQMLPWQHTSYFSLNIVRYIGGFDSIIIWNKFEFIVKAGTILKF